MNHKLIIYIDLKRKLVHVLLALLFSLSFISTGAQAYVNCTGLSCGRAEMMGSHHMDMSFSQNTQPMGCCSGIQGNPCTFETRKKVVVPDYAAAPNRVNSIESMQPIIIGEANLCPIQALNGLDPRIEFPTNARSAPIFIQTLSLRC